MRIMRHNNCKAFEINRGPTPTRTGLTKKRKQRSEIELLTMDFLANGGEVKELSSEVVGGPSSPAAVHSTSNLYARGE